MDEELETLSLDDAGREVYLQQEGGELKSVPDHLGTDEQMGYSVRYQRLAEVHGAWNSLRPDSASLLVIKITPRVHNFKDRFKMLSITMTVQLPKTTKGNFESPYFESYEPGEEGAWFMNEVINKRTDTGEVEGNISGQIPKGPELGLRLARTVAEESQRRYIHKVETTEEWAGGVDVSKTNKLTWTITPAEQSDGIGDHLVIGFLIQRAKGSAFRLKVESHASIGFFTDKWNNRPWGKKFGLGDFGPANTTKGELKPDGVNEGNLKQASDKKLLQELAYVHVPEKVVTRKNYSKPEDSQDTSLTSSTPKSPPANAASQVGLPAAMERPGAQAARGPLAPVPAPNEVRVQPPPQPSGLKGENHPSTRAQPKFPGSAAGGAAPAQEPVSQPLPVPSGYQTPIAKARVVRHRRMAALYRRLAQLHMEEAEEAERSPSMEAYADQTEREEYI